MWIEEIDAVARIHQFMPLLEQHADELATHRDIMIVNPDMERYKSFNEVGCLPSLGLFDDNGELAGYSVTFLTKSLHYSALSFAQNDVLFVRKDLRKGRWGLNLIKETPKLCKRILEDRTFLMLWHGKPNTSFSALMPKLDYKVQDIMFSKVF